MKSTEMISYPIQTKDGPISETRVKRLLLLALYPSSWHKRFYHQYYYLCNKGLVDWTLGTAFITDKGERELGRLYRMIQYDVTYEYSDGKEGTKTFNSLDEVLFWAHMEGDHLIDYTVQTIPLD